MNYCPGCQEPLGADEEQCPYCGYQLIATNKDEETTVQSPSISKKPFYKRGAFIASVIGLFIAGLLTAGGILGYDYYKKKQDNDFKKELTVIWLEVTNRSDQLATSIEQVESPNDLQNLKDDLADLSQFLASKQTEVVNLEAPDKYVNSQEVLANSIDSYNKYIYFLKLLLQKEVTEVRNDDYKKAKQLSEDSLSIMEKFVAETAFVNRKLPQEVFTVVNTIRPLIEKAQKQIITKQRTSKQQQQNAQKRTAQKTVSLFMQAKIDKSAAEMRRYITPSYDKVFDPEQEFAVTDTYSIDFKITETVLKSPNSFAISGEEVGKDLTGAKFINKWWFKVIKFEGDWLIDNRKLLEEGNELSRNNS